MILFSILVFVFGCLIGNFVADIILNDRYIKRWKKEYREFHDARICRLRGLYLTKKLLLHYVDTMEIIWKAYTGMLGGYETIVKNFETLDRHPEMTKDERTKLLHDIRTVALARYDESKGSDAAYAGLLKINMGDEHGKLYREIEEELRIMKEDFHDIDEETEELEEVKM